MEQRLRCRPREGRGLYRQPRFVQHRRRHVAVPARGAGCIGVVRKKNNFITLLPSPWGARAASTAIPQYLPKGTEVAVPVARTQALHSPPIHLPPQSAARCLHRHPCQRRPRRQRRGYEVGRPGKLTHRAARIHPHLQRGRTAQDRCKKYRRGL